MRCSVGAVGVALVEPLIAFVGPRIAFSVLAGLTALVSPLVWVGWRWGMRWRIAREKRIREREEEERRQTGMVEASR
jgi:hypothetical protein